MKRRLLTPLFAAALAMAAGAAWAVFDPVNDDTDIFLANPAFTATRPNVLIFVDNTANWSQATGGTAPLDTKYGGVKAALSAVITDLTDNFNVGMGLFVETGSPNNSTDGAYLRYGIRQMTATNKGELVNTIQALDNNGDKGNNATYSLAMDEVYNYFAGRSSRAGHGKHKADAGGTIYFPAGRSGLAGSPFAAGALPDNGGTVQTYVSPIVDGCQKNFVIVISNGEAADNAASLSAAEGYLTAIQGAAPATIPVSPSGEQGLWADEYAKFMANGDCNLSIAGVQNVYTYTIDILPKLTGQGPDHTALLQSMATNGKGKYFAVTDMTGTDQLKNALKTIFTEVQAVNSVFASTTLPVSVNVRGTNLNQVYIGVFRPDPNKSPRWLGNLKLYKLGVDTATSTLFLADSTGAAAENPSTGFISGSATSFWTTGTDFWKFRDPSQNGVGGISDSPDGDLVEKGGAAERLRLQYPTSQATRKLYTCVSGGGLCADGDALSATPFDTTNVLSGDLGAYLNYGITSLQFDPVSGLATGVLAATPSPAWASGNTVRISGVTPTAFNGDHSVAMVDATTFRYTPATPPDSTRARINAPNHLLVTGDIACVFASPLGFESCIFPTYAPLTRIDANNLDYTLSSPETGSANSITVFGGRQINSVRGLAGTTTATISLPGHGLGGAGTTIAEAYLFSADLGQWYTATVQTATIVDANTVNITTNNTIFGASNTAQVTSSGHGFSTGQTVTITGATVGSYNGAQTITKVDANTFTFPSAETSVDSSGAILAGHVISSITHPTTGAAAGRDTATVTTATAHGLIVGQSINLFGTGAFPGAGYDGSWIVQSTPSTTTFTLFNAAIDGVPTPLSPAAGLAGYAVSAITPVLSASGSIHFFRLLSVNSIVAQSSGQGSMTAGRPSDGDDATRDTVVAWMRGEDNVSPGENLDCTLSPFYPCVPLANPVPRLTDIRASIHGDVLHSRPATINYSRFPADPAQPANDNDIYAYYGSNDGLFRAVKGGIASNEGGISPGDERWAFVPKEFFARLKRLRDQAPAITNVTQKDYFFDGSIGVYQKDVVPVGGRAGTIGDDAGDKVHLYLSLRRGGNFIYALNVTDPANPKLLWRRGNGDAGWGEVGQTWSEPKVSRVNWNFDATNNPDRVVLIFGAGYEDRVEDINPCLLEEFNASDVVQRAIGTGTVTYTATGTCTISSPTGGTTTFGRSKGRGILVVNAFTGNVLWQVGPAPAGATHNLTHSAMTCAISSDISVLDRNRDGFADRLYVGDNCANLWRAEISAGDPRDWTVTKIAALSDGANTSITGKRKFQFPPDLVLSKDTPPGGMSPTFFSVLIGSGDREHPFDATVQNSFYMVKDRDSASAPTGVVNSSTKSINTPSSGSTDAPFTPSQLFDATNVSGVNEFGWKIDLFAGEKVVGTSVTIAGTTFFNTNQPSSAAGGGACGSNLGIAREYLVSFLDAAATTDLNALGTLSIANRSAIHAGGGYLPSPVPVVVEIGGKKYQAVISGTAVQSPPGLTLDARVRTYWYKEVD